MYLLLEIPVGLLKTCQILKKIETYILPYTDILAWCLMPNHFHLMVLIREEELPIENEGFTQSEALTSIESEALIS